MVADSPSDCKSCTSNFKALTGNGIDVNSMGAVGIDEVIRYQSS